MLTVVYVKCRKFGLYAECYNAECRKAECSGIVESGLIKIKSDFWIELGLFKLRPEPNPTVIKIINFQLCLKELTYWPKSWSIKF